MTQQTEKCQVVMLPQSREMGWDEGDMLKFYHELSIISKKLKLANFSSGGGEISHNYWKPQHLYLVSDELIKEGDWYITIRTGEDAYMGEPKECVGIDERNNVFATINGNPNHTYWTEQENAFKIVASTDKSLGLPLIPQSFLELYVEKQGDIKEVEINWNTQVIESQNYDELDIFINEPKLDKDGCIIIHQAKDTFTLEDMRKAFSIGVNHGEGIAYSETVEPSSEIFEQFINSL